MDVGVCVVVGVGLWVYFFGVWVCSCMGLWKWVLVCVFVVGYLFECGAARGCVWNCGFVWVRVCVCVGVQVFVCGYLCVSF